MNFNIKEIHSSILESESNSQTIFTIDESSIINNISDECEEETKKLSLMISKSFHKELRIFCAAEEITITMLVVAALREYLLARRK